MDIQNSNDVVYSGVVGKLGRVVLPADIRKRLKLLPGTPITMAIQDEKVVIALNQEKGTD